MHKPTSKYSPEIEARRADYERLAAALLTMVNLQVEPVDPRLDVPSQRDDDRDHVLIDAIEVHLFLAFENIDWYTPEAMELYVEMRLLGDQQKEKQEAEKEGGSEDDERS